MKITSATQKSMPDNPVWYFLAEFLLSEFLSDHDQRNVYAAGLLFQTVRELGIPPECVENMERTLTGFAQEALVHFKQGKLEIPGRIRIFCQKKIFDNANLAPATSRPHPTQPAVEHAQMIHHSSAKMDGGWGYFLIERGGDASNGSSMSSCNSVDLYLYREGE